MSELQGKQSQLTPVWMPDRDATAQRGQDGGHLAQRDSAAQTQAMPQSQDLPIVISASRKHLPPQQWLPGFYTLLFQQL